MQKIFQFLTTLAVWVSLACSITFFVHSSLPLFNSKVQISFSTIYSIVHEYSGLYKFTFIVIAAYLGLKQLELSQKNYQKTLDQLKFTQDDILYKKEIDKNKETLAQCKYYFTELQGSIKELTEKQALTGLPIRNSQLRTITNDALKENTHLYKIVSALLDTHNKEVLIVLYKFEAYAAQFNFGNLDSNLGKEIVGKIYTSQIELLIPLIAIYRKDDSSHFAKNIITLFNKWND